MSVGGALRLAREHVGEAATSLVRGWRTSVLSLATIVAAVFALGAILLASSTARRVVERWTHAAEMSVYLHAQVAPGDRDAVRRALTGDGSVMSVEYIDAADASRRFAREFPDLASLATAPGAPPLPASFEVRLRADDAGRGAAHTLAARARSWPGVADVRYDHGLVERVSRAVTVARRIAFAAAAVLALAAVLAVLSVVRLSYVSRRDEVDVMTLVGAPFAAIRGPFVAEGWLQGFVGGALAIALLWVGFVVARARFGASLVEATGLERLEFLPAPVWIGLVVSSGIIGAIAGVLAVERRLSQLT